MVTWGVGIFDDDTAGGVRDAFEDSLAGNEGSGRASCTLTMGIFSSGGGVL